MKPQRQGFRVLVAAIALALSGCASVSLEQTLASGQAEIGGLAGVTSGDAQAPEPTSTLALARSPDEHEARRQMAAQLLARPLGADAAVQLALVNSPALQALLAAGWAEAASAAQTGRISNPVLSLERVVGGGELELAQVLTFGLLDVLSLPYRKDVAEQRIRQAHLLLAGELVEHLAQVRQAWVRAVAAAQSLEYARKVYNSAETSAELARRMEAVGNFNKLDRARQQLFYADAATQLVQARHQAMASRETLVRLLGLDAAQAVALTLPERLPDLPRQPLQAQDMAQQLSRGRLDIRQAQAALDAAARAQGLNRVTSVIDLELGVIREAKYHDGQLEGRARGYELELRLPVFDWGGMQRDAMSAQTLAAASRLEATLRAAGSHLRESYSAYRSAFDIARHYRDEVVPLRKRISDENLLRYNGMLIGVFELMADSREQVGAVKAAIGALEQFWLADAALRASVLGRPMAAGAGAAAGAAGASAAPAADGGH